MRTLPLVALAGCASLHPMPEDQACLDAGYAISRRTLECTDDPELANARFELFVRDYRCKPLPEYEKDTGIATIYLRPVDTGLVGVSPADFFHCAFAISQLACELVVEYGDDLYRYLEASEACAYVVEPKGGER